MFVCVNSPESLLMFRSVLVSECRFTSCLLFLCIEVSSRQDSNPPPSASAGHLVTISHIYASQGETVVTETSLVQGSDQI